MKCGLESAYKYDLAPSLRVIVPPNKRFELGYFVPPERSRGRDQNFIVHDQPPSVVVM